MQSVLIGPLTLLTLFAATPVFPQSHADKRVNCGDLRQQMSRCYARDAELVTQQLDELIAELAHVLSKDELRSLGDAQESWRIYRDKHCRWQSRQSAPGEGGSTPSTAHSSCVIDMTWQRIATLKGHLCAGAETCAASRRYDRRTQPIGPQRP